MSRATGKKLSGKIWVYHLVKTYWPLDDIFAQISMMTNYDKTHCCQLIKDIGSLPLHITVISKIKLAYIWG